MAITYFSQGILFIFYIIYFSIIIILVVIGLYHTVFITFIRYSGILFILFLNNFALREALSLSNCVINALIGRIQKCLITNYTTGFG